MVAFFWGFVTLVVLYFAIFAPIVIVSLIVDRACWYYTLWAAKRRTARWHRRHGPSDDDMLW